MIANADLGNSWDRRLKFRIWLITSSLLLLGLTPSVCSPAPATSSKDSRLHALGTAREDSAYRYLAEKGAELFRGGRFAESERYYRAALLNAEHDGIHDRRLAMLVTNLATDLRQQQKYEESETLFERAVEIERRLLKKDDELMLYTARQYAALLRETARDASGEEIIASAHKGFAMAPVVPHTPTGDDQTNSSDETDRETEHKKIARSSDQDSADRFHDPPSVTSNTSPSPQLSVMAELKMLADIEHGYMSETMPPSQILPSSFSYLNSGPLFSSPGFSGAYIPFAGGGLRMHVSGHSMGGGGHHR